MIRNYKLLFIALVAFYSCNDYVELKESDLEKYSWLTPFCSELTGTFCSGTHNVDLGKMEFSYYLSADSYGRSTIDKMDSISKVNKWKILCITDSSITISKLISMDVKDGGQITIRIKFDKEKNKLFYNIE